MSILRRCAQWIRHLPSLERADWFWQRLRTPYHRLLDAGKNGVEVVVGGSAVVRIPAEYAGHNWEQYESEAVAAFARWVRQHPGALILDVGSSLGIFSAIALFADPHAEVVAFDSDLASLAAVRRLCMHAAGTRLRLALGFVAEQPTTIRSLVDVSAATEAALATSGIRGDAGTTRYICLADGHRESIPVHRLDDLFMDESLEGRSVLIKCDVEGAELLVLRGAEAVLRRASPAIALSVHPPALPAYGHSRADVEAFMKRLGYEVSVLAVDHEEHWWCERRA